MGGRSWVFGLELGVVALWAAWIVWFQGARAPAGEGGAPREGMVLLETVESEGAEWLGIYVEGTKVGVALSDRVATRDGWKIQERSYVKLRAFDQDKEITTAFIAQTDRDGRLASFTFYLAAPPVQTDVRGRVKDGNLDLIIRSGGEESTQSFPLPDGPPELAVTFKDRVVARRPAVGEVLELPYFDPASLARQTLKVTVVERGKVQVGDRSLETYTLQTEFSGFTSRVVLTEEGHTVEESGALGMTLRGEPREAALYEGWDGREPADLIALSVVPVRRPIPSPRKVRNLSVKLTGGGVEALLKDAWGGFAGDVMGRIDVSIPPEQTWQPPMLPVIDPRFAPELAATPMIPSQDVTIAATARSAIDDYLRADQAAKLLVDFVHQRLRKVPTMGVPSALEVLKVGQGDCNEHTVLYTALARSVGLPTRMVAGVVYSDVSYGGQGFLYHAWPEVWLGTWVPVDPTFGQFPADATHIKLVVGDLDKQLALMRVVGNLNIDVIGVE